MLSRQPEKDVRERAASGGLRLALPSDGELHESTLTFLRDCGLTVRRPNARRYTGAIPAVPGVSVLFQRTADITQKVEEGSVDLGITGLDRAIEYCTDETRAVTLMEDLGYGRCDFVLAVPEAWLDVASVDDLADLALEFHGRGQQLRIATKYPKLLRRYLFRRGINYFTLVAVSGALEAAPAAGYADLIADLTASGATLRENRLKTLEGGTILSSQACVIGNPLQLGQSRQTLELARQFLEMVEARMRAEPYYRLSANVRGRSPQEVSATILARPELAGLRGPTIARVYNVAEEDWYGVSLVVKKDRLLDVVSHLRDCGAVDISATQVSYLFGGESEAYRKLAGTLVRDSSGNEIPPGPPLRKGGGGDFGRRHA
ncbi:MAG: ATP phosphoribosyltransferase [SAR202 cluster bacterium]|nr:ATP phosphoribosyltransferase [SAR202 cluster bacterium]